jgi:hypothetical protein
VSPGRRGVYVTSIAIHAMAQVGAN